MENNITHVYVFIDETDVIGAWTDPEDVVKYVYKYALKIEGGISLENQEKLLTVKETIKKLLDPDHKDYPYLKKIKINPTNDGDAQNAAWELNR